MISPNKTWEGLLGGGVSASLIAGSLYMLTPFKSFYQSAGCGALLIGMGFLGGLTMSAVKRDRGVKDFGTLIPGHGGMMDRIDSISFAAPVFFHLLRYLYEV